MSAFLGPIHYWLYNKIQWHEDLLDSIYDLIEAQGQDVQLIRHYTSREFGAPERAELADVIDGGNIHGWLQTKIQSLEYRMAYVITHALNHKILTLDTLEKCYHDNGKLAYDSYPGSMETPQEMFKAMYDYLLEGMPCDRVNQPVSVDENAMIWIKKMCIHSEYWAVVKGDVKIHDALRAAWLQGFVSGEFELQVSTDLTYKLIRRAA